MKKVIFILLFFSCCFSGTIIDVVKNFGNNHFGFYSGSPTTGTWDVGDMISDNSSGNIRIWYCTSKGTFGSYSNTGSTVNGSPHIYGVSATTGALIGQYVTLSAGFSAGQKKIIAKSSHVGSTTTGATSDGSSQILSSVSNYLSYQLGDYVQVSKGWASTTAAYRVISIDSVNQRLTLDVASNSAQTGITATPVRAITVDANATSTQATCNITQVSPTFLSFGKTYSDTTNSTSTTTGSIVTSGGLGVAKTINCDSINVTKGIAFSTRWNDMDQFVLSSAKNIGQTGAPTLTATGDGFSRYLFAVNDSLIGNIELKHEFVENDTLHCHFHYSPARVDAGAKHVKFSAHIKYRNIGDSLTKDTTLTKEDTIAANTGRLTHKFFEVGELPTPNLKIGAMIDVCIKRIASSGGTTDTLSPFIAQFGIHRKVNSIGSRTETTK